jgi:hypothetical protein
MQVDWKDIGKLFLNVGVKKVCQDSDADNE